MPKRERASEGTGIGSGRYCSTRARRFSSAATTCTGTRIVLNPKRPIFTLMYSGSPSPFRKSLSARPIFCPRGSQTVYPAYSSRVQLEPLGSLRFTAMYGVRMGKSSLLRSYRCLMEDARRGVAWRIARGRSYGRNRSTPPERFPRRLAAEREQTEVQEDGQAHAQHDARYYPEQASPTQR